jgi:hypothetical protein
MNSTEKISDFTIERRNNVKAFKSLGAFLYPPLIKLGGALFDVFSLHTKSDVNKDNKHATEE